MTKQTLIVFYLSLVGLVTWAALPPPAAPSNAEVGFAGYTNDTTGTQLASFTVSNTNASAVRLHSHY